MSTSRKAVAVDFFADLSCPWCYVGWAALKQAALAARDTTATQLTWRTFMLSPDAPAEGFDRKAYLAERFDDARLAAANEALLAAAAAAEAPINLNAATRIPSTIDAHRVIHWASAYGAAETLIDALFTAYFVEGEDISDHAVLLAHAEAKGLDPQEIAARLNTDEDRQLMLDFHAAAAQLGIRGVPIAIFNRRTPVMGAGTIEGYARALATA